MATRGFNIKVVSGAKAYTILGDEGWVTLGGDTKEKAGTITALSSRVAIVFRGMTLRANAVSSIPFDMTDLEGTVVDSSDDWQNTCGFFPNPENMFWQLEAAWTLYGRGYCHQSKNGYNYTKIFKYLAPDSVQYDKDKNVFVRNNKDFQPALDKDGKPTEGESIVSLWMPDPDIEHGPPLKCPGKAAFSAMGVIYNLDESSLSFFKNGMLHTYIFKVGAGTQQADVELLEEKVNQKLRGVSNFFKALFLKSEKFDPVDIGGGLDWLSNVPLTKEKREDIAVALGVPLSMLFTDSASGLGSGGVANSDDKKMITATALPDFRNIIRQLNEQVFIPAGYRLIERHEKLDVFKETESALGDTLTKYVTAFNTNPELAVELAELLGITISDEKKKALLAIARKKPEPTQFENVNQPKPTETQMEDEAPDTTKAIDIEYNKEMQRYQRKALKKIGQLVEFESDIIPLDVLRAIQIALPGCHSEDEVKQLFANKSIKSEMKTREIGEIDKVIKSLEMNLDILEKGTKSDTYNITMPPITLNATMPDNTPSVTVNVPEQPTPTVTVTNEVKPTPITIENNVKASDVIMPELKTIKINRDQFGRPDTMEAK